MKLTNNKKQRHEYYLKNRKKLLIKANEYQKTHKEERKEYAKKYCKKNKQKLKRKHKIYSKLYYLKNKTKIDKINKQYAKEHPEKMKRYRHKFIKNNPDIYLWNSVRNRCNHNKFKLKITREEFLNWYNKQKKICVYCNLKEENWLKTKDSLTKLYKRLQIDRKDNTKGYSLNNIVLACPRCNITKSDFFSYKQMRKVGEIINASR